MKEWFIKRGYSESVFEKEMKKVHFSERLRREYHLLLPTTHYLVNCPL